MTVELVTREDLNDLTKKVDTILEFVLAREKKSKVELYTNNDLCEILHVSKRTLQNYRDSGQIKFKQNGRKIYYTADALKAYMDNNGIILFDNKKNKK